MIILPALTDAELIARVNQIGPQTKVEEALLERLEEMAECSAIVAVLDHVGIDATSAKSVSDALELLHTRLETVEGELIDLHEKLAEFVEAAT